ncbi:TPA: hypothetical protein QCV70_002481 [Bacillus cereus]|nr:hypothetical protein [Bacillus cereus]
MDNEQVKAFLETALNEVNNGITDSGAFADIKQMLNGYGALLQLKELVALKKIAKEMKNSNSNQSADDEAIADEGT